MEGGAGGRPVINFHYTFSNRRDFRIRVFGVHGTGDLSHPELRTAVFHVGLCLLGWVVMEFPARRLLVRAGYLSAAQAAWWGTTLDHTLAELFYLNTHLGPWPGYFVFECQAKRGLHARCLGTVPTSALAGDPTGAEAQCVVAEKGKKEGLEEEEEEEEHEVLVPLGGGKDSLTVWEMLARCPARTRMTWFFLGMRLGEFEQGPYAALARECSRSVPPIVLECDFTEHRDASVGWRLRLGRRPLCTKEMAPPWALLVAFSSVLVTCAAAVQRGGGNTHPLFIAVGNEHSANEGNVEHNGVEVNHQFDKSFAFERTCHHYVRAHVCARVHYFSALQHLWELAVAREFAAACRCGAAGAGARGLRFVGTFLSCNQPVEQRNCGGCAKCCFVFAMLSAFLEPEAAARPFGGNVFANPRLFPIFEQLMGLAGHKPFECVGTAQEVLAALHLARAQYVSAAVPLPCFFRDYATAIASGADFLHLLDYAAPAHMHLCPAWFLRSNA